MVRRSTFIRLMDKIGIGDIVRFRKDDYWYKQTMYPYRDRLFRVTKISNAYTYIKLVSAPTDKDPEWMSQDGDAGGFDHGSLEKL